MQKVLLGTAFGPKDKPILRHVKGNLDSGDATDLGMLFYQAHGEDDPFFGNDGFYYYPDHPRNMDALRRMKDVFASREYTLRVNLRNLRGEDAKPIMLPSQVPTLQKSWASIFGGNVEQAGQDVRKVADDLIVQYHHHLANAGILFVLEDYEPDKMGAAFGVQGEVWGFCQRLGGEFRRLTGYDFKITFCAGVWEIVKPVVKTWLCDHELMHCDRNERGVWCVRDHDIEMFTDEAERYPKMGPIVAKMNRLLEARYAGDSEEEPEEEHEIVRPKLKRKKSKDGVEALVINSASSRTLHKAARSRVGVCTVPRGMYRWIKEHPSE